MTYFWEETRRLSPEDTRLSHQISTTRQHVNIHSLFFHFLYITKTPNCSLIHRQQLTCQNTTMLLDSPVMAAGQTITTKSRVYLSVLLSSTRLLCTGNKAVCSAQDAECSGPVVCLALSSVERSWSPVAGVNGEPPEVVLSTCTCYHMISQPRPQPHDITAVDYEGKARLCIRNQQRDCFENHVKTFLLSCY